MSNKMSGSKRRVAVSIDEQGDHVYHKVDGLPDLNQLNSRVKKIIEQSSHWERYGKGHVENGIAIPLHLVSCLIIISHSQML